MAIFRALSVAMALAFASVTMAENDGVSFAVNVPARRMECFFFEIPAHKETTIDFAVVRGGSLDINAYVRYPGERRNDYYVSRVEDGEHKFVAKAKPAGMRDTEDWAYEFCIDNGFSMTVDKLVEVDVWYDDDDVLRKSSEEGLSVVERLIKDTKNQLKNSYRTLTYLRHREARHRDTAESNYERVNWFSTLMFVGMAVVPILQIILIRRMLGGSSPSSGSGSRMSSHGSTMGGSAGISF